MAVVVLRTFCSSDSSRCGVRCKNSNSYYRSDSVKRKIIHVKMKHARTVKSGTDYRISNARVLYSYVESGLMEEAQRLFETSKNFDSFLWNLMIKGYVDVKLYEQAIDFYYRMQFVGIRPDNFTFPFVIKAYAGLFWFKEGWKVHCQVIKLGLYSDIFICNSLITMYGKIGLKAYAEKVFDEIPKRDLVSWNSMIAAYVLAGEGWKSLSCFREMQEYEMRVDRFSLMEAISACALENALQGGKEIHGYVIRGNFESDIMIQTTLIDMYGKCRQIDLSEKLFRKIFTRNVIVWNTLISGFVLSDRPHEALGSLVNMQVTDKLNPDNVTMVNVLPACSSIKDLLKGRSIHGFAIRKGFLPHLVLETSLIDFYAKCGKIILAKQVFSWMKQKSLTSFNVMISSYVQNGRNIEAIKLFLDLLEGSEEPDVITISSIMPAFSELMHLREAKQIHAYVTKYGYVSNLSILNSIIYLYAKCGDLHAAERVFLSMTVKDVVTWNTIIAAYGIHGCGKTAIELFVKMQETGIKPNESTFVSLLSSCSTAGLVDEGWKYFDLMQEHHGIEPQIEHYGCMIDLIGRMGNLELAQDFIRKMPLTPTARIWGSLLLACRKQRNIELAEMAANYILASNHDNTGCYVLLCNMYVEAKRWEDVRRIRTVMKKESIERIASCSTVELNGKTSRFVNGDKTHSEIHLIYDVLDIISKLIGEENHAKGTIFNLSNTAKKRNVLPKFHSVRLALFYGLICSNTGSPILIKKNVRICEDCHSAMKKISRAIGREIIVGDSKMYHHFKDGSCCCMDYW